jgi:hypothetical protein
LTATVGQDIDSIFYVVLARGLIVDSGRANFKSGKRSASIYITPDFRYARDFYVIAYYVSNSGVLIAKNTQLYFFYADLPNYVSPYFLNHRFFLIK